MSKIINRFRHEDDDFVVWDNLIVTRARELAGKPAFEAFEEPQRQIIWDKLVDEVNNMSTRDIVELLLSNTSYLNLKALLGEDE